jgi:hypothetical protein
MKRDFSNIFVYRILSNSHKMGPLCIYPMGLSCVCVCIMHYVCDIAVCSDILVVPLMFQYSCEKLRGRLSGIRSVAVTDAKY